MSMSSPVLWQNQDQTVTIIDVPRSIAAAQGTPEESCTDVLLSSEPLRKPFPSTEPRSTHARRHVGDAADDALHEDYQSLLEQAIAEVRASYHAEWSLKRAFLSSCRRSMGVSSRKRKANGEEDDLDNEDRLIPSLPSSLFASITKPCLNPPDVRVWPEDHTSDGEYEPGNYIWNHNLKPATMTLTSHDINTGKSTHYNFRLPANSTFFLGDCSVPEMFHELVTEHQQNFDFILLDPPWPNRSVKRTHKTPGTSYSVTSTTDDIRDLLLNLDLSTQLSEAGYLGIWITNKPAIRELVLSLFDHCRVDLIEEWIWLKTTATGEPVTPLEGTWNGRKPYEVLLVGRKRASDGSSCKEEVKRRVLIGVPDLHSRKPCLKELIRDFLGYHGTVLEVFARYLVAGWWSWGDECVKFNWEGFWQSRADENGGMTKSKDQQLSDTTRSRGL